MRTFQSPGFQTAFTPWWINRSIMLQSPHLSGDAPDYFKPPDAHTPRVTREFTQLPKKKKKTSQRPLTKTHNTINVLIWFPQNNKIKCSNRKTKRLFSDKNFHMFSTLFSGFQGTDFFNSKIGTKWRDQSRLQRDYLLMCSWWKRWQERGTEK